MCANYGASAVGITLERRETAGVLIPMAALRGIESGEIDLAFRSWTRPAAKAGGSQTTPIGMLAIESVERVDPAD